MSVAVYRRCRNVRSTVPDGELLLDVAVLAFRTSYMARLEALPEHTDSDFNLVLLNVAVVFASRVSRQVGTASGTGDTRLPIVRVKSRSTRSIFDPIRIVSPLVLGGRERRRRRLRPPNIRRVFQVVLVTSERRNKSPAEVHSLLSNAGWWSVCVCERGCVWTRDVTTWSGVVELRFPHSERGISRELLGAADHRTRKHIVECTGRKDRGTAYDEPTSVGFFSFTLRRAVVLTAFPLNLIEISHRYLLGVFQRTLVVMRT